MVKVLVNSGGRDGGELKEKVVYCVRMTSKNPLVVRGEGGMGRELFNMEMG